MHKGVLLLTKALDREEALNNVSNFMEDYQDNVFDWYAIGNRWHNILAPKEKLDEFDKWVKKTYKHAFTENVGYAINDLENNKDRKKIQQKWESLGLKGKNIYYSAYGHSTLSGFGLPEEEDDYNCILLKDCLDTVKEWCQDLDRCTEELWKKALEHKAEEEKEGKGTLSAYYAKKYANMKYENFCFDTNVFNIDEYEAEKIPEDIENYYVVVVDMHN